MVIFTGCIWWYLIYIYIYLYILSVFSFTDTDDLWDGKGREGTIFHSALPILPAHEHWDIYLQLHVRWLSRIFNRNACVYKTATRWDLPPYRTTIYCLIDDAMFVCLLEEFILRFCHSDFTWETGGFELTSTITLVLQANRLTKCAGQYPNFWCQYFFGIAKRLM